MSLYTIRMLKKMLAGVYIIEAAVIILSVLPYGIFTIVLRHIVPYPCPNHILPIAIKICSKFVKFCMLYAISLFWQKSKNILFRYLAMTRPSIRLFNL